MTNVYTFRSKDDEEELVCVNDDLEGAKEYAADIFEGQPFTLIGTQQHPGWEDFEAEFQPVARRTLINDTLQDSSDSDSSTSDFFIDPSDMKSVPNFHDLAQAKRVFTVLDCDGLLWVAPGYHFVNRYAYIVTAVPYSDKTPDFAYA